MSRGFTCCSDRVVRSIVVLSVCNVVYAPARARCALRSMVLCSRICLVLPLVVSEVCGHRCDVTTYTVRLDRVSIRVLRVQVMHVV